MFQFLMAAPYEERKVGRWENEDKSRVVSTCSVNDGRKPYETAIAHEKYNDGSWVIVENYDTKHEAEQGHAKWVRLMEGDNLPTSLTDCCNARTGEVARAIGCNMIFERND